MRKLIAAINMTLDGYCDHTAISPDDEIHAHYNDVLRNAGLLIYGRITYQMMESYWPLIVKNPTGNIPTDEFSVIIDDIPKIVYSRTMKTVNWNNSALKNEVVAEEILDLKQQSGKNILVGSPSMIVKLSQLQLIDEYQIAIHPVVLGSGLPLFKNIGDKISFTLTRIKTFTSGAVIHYYKPLLTI